RENTGRLAVTRGPVVYCMEEADNGKNLHLTEVNVCGEAKTFETDEMGEHFVRICMEGRKLTSDMEENESLYHVFREEIYEKKQLSFLPYYMWNNRGEGELQVWVRAYQEAKN
ncbi:MAG: glycoside hydrolase family 127 protein, partial [Fusicatenibacter sp.]|nr:glycoside hydrolase family 127 protein [Fusicatenibacter sp.]